MRQRPGAIDDLTVDWGSSGATIGVRILDGDTEVAARETGFVESADVEGFYVLADYEFPSTLGTFDLVYDDDAGAAGEGHVAIEELIVTGEPYDPDTYGNVDELFRILKIRTPSAEQTAAGERVLAAASGEIDSEIDLAADVVLAGWQVSLATEVALERAAELWKEQETQFGLVGIGSEMGPVRIGNNTWEKYAMKLAPLKNQWGLA